MVQANQKFNDFIEANPDYQRPQDVDLSPSDVKDATRVFKAIDNDQDVQAQMKIDPTGGLTVFWQEQKRKLHSGKRSRWNPQVITDTTTQASPP